MQLVVGRNIQKNITLDPNNFYHLSVFCVRCGSFAVWGIVLWHSDTHRYQGCGVDKMVVVVREACDVAMYHKLCASSSSPSHQVTGERTTLCRHAAPSLQMPSSRRVQK